MENNYTFINQSEDILLNNIFKNSISIFTFKNIKTYRICFNNKYYEFYIDTEYPSKPASCNNKLSSKIIEKYKNKFMIYQLLYECVKSEELSLNDTVEYISYLDFNTTDKITEEQFLEFKKLNSRSKKLLEGQSGKEIFLSKGI